MIKIVLCGTILLTHHFASASTARLADLNGAITPDTDIQEAFDSPAKLWNFEDAILIEYGANQTGLIGTTAAPRAQGAIVRTNGDSKLGLWFGRQSETILNFASGAGQGTGANLSQANALYLDNPINFVYAEKGETLNWGVGLFYANSKDQKGSDQFKKNVMELKLSVVAAEWTAAVTQSLGAKIEAIGDDLAGSNQQAMTLKKFSKISAQYDFDDLSIAGSYQSADGKLTNPNGSNLWEVETSNMILAFENKLKTETAHLFYGIGINVDLFWQKTGTESKRESSYQPIWFGLEADAVSWLTLRSAYKQNFMFFDTSKVSTGATVTDSKAGASTNTVTAGAAFRFDQTTIDFNWSVATSGSLSTADFGTNAALTYTY